MTGATRNSFKYSIRDTRIKGVIYGVTCTTNTFFATIPIVNGGFLNSWLSMQGCHFGVRL